MGSRSRLSNNNLFDINIFKILNMTREEAKKILPILTAYAEGKTVQVSIYKWGQREWVDLLEEFPFGNSHFKPGAYRIKPTYRPFRNGAECREEMQKHEPFGWVKIKNDPTNATVGIAEVNDTYMEILSSCFDGSIKYEVAFEKLTFIDGTPFGMKEE